MRKNNDQDGLMDLQDSLIAQAEAQVAKEPEFKFTPEQVKAYTTVGGTPIWTVHIPCSVKCWKVWILLIKYRRSRLTVTTGPKRMWLLKK